MSGKQIELNKGLRCPPVPAAGCWQNTAEGEHYIPCSNKRYVHLYSKEWNYRRYFIRLSLVSVHPGRSKSSMCCRYISHQKDKENTTKYIQLHIIT